jgi:pimeloyl-ACP methyl ester carboxylesterase
LAGGTGIDPAVLKKQGAEIGNSINNDFFGDGNVSSDLAVMLAGLSETSPNDPVAVWRTSVEARDADWWFGLRQRLGLVAPYPHLVDLPQGYDADPAKRWPLILYLHSGIHFGHDLKVVRASGLAGLIANGKQLPAVVVSPQCPSGESWNVRILGLLLDEVSAKYRIDPDRIYVTGISAGGDATFELATAHPERIAAIAPIAGDGDAADAVQLKDVPIWDFQGMKDTANPPQNPIAVVQAVRLAGGHAHQTLYPDAGHYDSWGLAYGTEALYTWLLAQKRGQPEVVTPGVPVP